MMELGLRGKRAFVTGGTSGIGLAVAQALGTEGASLIVAGRDSARRDRAVESLRAKGCQVRGVELDISQESGIRAALAQALSDGPIDILVVNVGGPATGTALGVSQEGWDQGYQSLLRSTILLCRGCVPGMRERKWGRILTITSTTAKEIIPRLPVSSVFRSGLTAWAKELAKEVGRDGILVNNLLPGPTRTERLADLAVKSPDFFQAMERESALGRVAEPEEIGRVGAFLCSAANTYVTGTDILADGGFTKAL